MISLISYSLGRYYSSVPTTCEWVVMIVFSGTNLVSFLNSIADAIS